MSSGDHPDRLASVPAFRICSLALLAAACLPLHGQQLVFEEFGFDKGLGNSAINCLLTDRRGFLWAGTMSGLYRGDGERFRKFAEAQGLPDATIQSLLEDSNGRLWVATRTGIAWMEGGRFHPAALEPPAEIYSRRALAVSAQGRILAATARGLYEGGQEGGRWKFTRRTLPAPPGATAVDAVFAEPGGALWLSAGKALWRLSGDRAEPWGADRGVPATRWDDFLLDPEGTLWVRGADALIALRAGAAAFENRTGPLPSSGFFGSLALDNEGRLLVPTDNGLFVLGQAGWKRYGVQQGLPGQSVSAALQDHEDSLWVGLWGLGLIRVAGYRWTETWTVQDGLGSSTVSAVLEDREGRIWAGTDNGISILAPGEQRWRPGPAVTSLCGSKVRALALAPDGAVWAGCFPGGVARIGPGRQVRVYSPSRGNLPDRVNAMLVDGEGRLWVASLEGLFRSRGPAAGPQTVLERLRPPDSAPDEAFFRMARGRGGEVWIATSHGLLLWTQSGWQRFGTAAGLRETALSHVAVDAGGDIWVACRRPLGVTRLRRKAGGGIAGAEHFLEELSSPAALLLRADPAGRVWVGGDNGLDVFHNGRWRRFAKADGLAAYSCAVDALLAARDGSIWIGTSRGLTHILQPERALEPPRQPVPLVLSWVRPGGEEIEVWHGETVRIDPGMRSFSARLAALTFRHRSGLRFEYRLLGHHENWVETAGTEIRYSSIPPGKYVLEARAVWPRGEPAVSALRIRVAVPAPFWMTWPARAALGLLALVLLRAVWGWRVRALKERQRWLEEAVRERTRQLQSEKERTAEALARAEQASRFKSEFLARMSHEIRTPMHGVIGTADLLMGSRLDPSQQELVRTLKESAAVLMNLLNDILDLSRVEAGKLSLAVRPFDLAALVQTVAGLMQPIAKKKGLDLRVSLPAGPLWFAGDGHRVQQILLNLVSNAVKFTHAGFVEVAVAAPAELYGKGFELIVRDTGCGIPPDRIDSIFQPFVQVGGDPAAAAAGTGLGLSVAKALVDAMGGMIEVDSRPGHGSTFRVRLPLAAAEPVPEPAPAASAPSSAPLRVLVVEDNPVNRQLIARMLAVLGHQAEAAPDGETALRLASRDVWDVILLDIRLPGIDGLETARRLRQAGCRATLIALSANVYESDRAAALAAGMDGFLGKPLHLDELREALDAAARRPPDSGPA